MNTKTTLVDKILQNRTVSHVLFWVVFLLVMSIWSSLNYGSLKDNFINNLALLPAQIIATYLLVYYQVPQFLLKKKYGKFIFSLSISIYVLSIIARLCIVYLSEPFIRQDFEQETFLEIISEPFYLLIVYFPAVYMVGFIMFALKSIKDRLEEKNQLEVLQKEKATNELKFLKAQIHPHFLFNTLNNLYALTLSKSDAAPKVVVKLSELLDYILYQCNEPYVEIHKELELLQGYIDLEMLRYGKQLDLVFEHNIDNKNTLIAPLILLSIIENAFKHGASGNPIDPKIHIDLKVENAQLFFKVFNTKTSWVKEEGKNNSRKSKQIGTINLKRQLELNYPHQYKLEVRETKKSYTVILNIDLK